MSGPQRITNLPTTPPPAAPEKPSNPLRTIQEYAGKVMDIAMAPANIANQAVAKATRFIAQALPSFPAARILQDMVIGLPHAHGHPPNLIPPAPPVPLPSIGPVLCAGAVSVLINGTPAARCGDVGFGVWCGGAFPLFEVQTGSSHVFIGGARASRVTDVTKHCMPSTGLGKLGAALTAASAAMGAVGVGADLIDMSAMDDAAADAGSAADAAADAAAASALAKGAVVQAAQTAADLAAAALQAAAGSDPAIPPGLPMGTFMHGSPNVVIGGFPMPGWMAILHGLAKLLKKLRARIYGDREGGYRPRRPKGQSFGERVTTDEPLFKQEKSKSCAIACARMVIASLLGRNIDEMKLREVSQDFPGAYRRGVGTNSAENLPGLLGRYGIPAEARSGGLADLGEATSRGRPAIASVKTFDENGNEKGAHAVVVDRVYTDPDGTSMVQGRDPATGEAFQNTDEEWQRRSNNKFVSTDPDDPAAPTPAAPPPGTQ
jgi:uncharacterized Zn-binding protein involved in type VI secretion